MASAAIAGPMYDQCILDSMKGVSSDLAARLVDKACRAKEADADQRELDSRRSRYGRKLDPAVERISLVTTPTRDVNGLRVAEFRNETKDTTVTLVRFLAQRPEAEDAAAIAEVRRACADEHPRTKKEQRPRPRAQSQPSILDLLDDEPSEAAARCIENRSWAIKREAVSSLSVHSFVVSVPPGRTVQLAYRPKAEHHELVFDELLGRPSGWRDLVSKGGAVIESPTRLP
jgi:hypothetical protein